MSPFISLYSFMKKPWVILLVLLLLTGSYFYIDKPLAIYFADFQLQTNANLLTWLTILGENSLYLGTFLMTALFFRYVKKHKLWEQRFYFLWLVLISCDVICGVLKIILGRARPIMWLENQQYGFYGFQTKSLYWSCPSGHSTTIMAIAFSLCILFPRYFYAFIIAGFSVALSRVLLTQHYLSDVLAATYLDILEIGFIIWLLKTKGWLAYLWQQDNNYVSNLNGVGYL